MSDAQPHKRCPRDSDWCDGTICKNIGFANCPNADPPVAHMSDEELLALLRRARGERGVQAMSDESTEAGS